MNLLKTEWLKVKNYRTFWILVILYLVSIWGANYIAYTIQEKIYTAKEAGNVANMILGNRPYSFPKVWQMTSNVSSYLLFIAGLLMIILVTNEYSFKTHRQNIIDGLTRTQFIVTKLACGSIIAFASTVLVFLTALFFGSLQNVAEISFEGIQFLLYFFLQALSYTWMAILFGLIFKRSGIAIGIFFLYTLVIENVLALILNRVVPTSSFINGLGNYLPIESTDQLLPTPFLENAKRELDIREVNTTLQLIIALFYLASFFLVSKRKFETDDL